MDEQQPVEAPGGAGGEQGKRPGEEGTEQQSAGSAQRSTASLEEPGVFQAVKDWASELFGQASEIIMRPGEFFANLPAEGGLGRATVFAVVMGAVAGILGFALRVLPGFRVVFTTPFAAFAATVVGALLVHVLAMVAGGKGSLEASYRFAAYMMVFLPLVVVAQVLPYLHVAMAGYALYALVIGVAPVHGLEERRSWSVFGSVGAVVLVIVLVGSVLRH